MKYGSTITHQPINVVPAETGGRRDPKDVDFNNIIHSALPSTYQNLVSILNRKKFKCNHIKNATHL